VQVENCAGIYYHPVRKRWVLLYGESLFRERESYIDKTKGALKVGECTIKFSGGVDFINTDSICYARIPVVINKVLDPMTQQLQETKPYLPVLPVKPEFLDLVDPSGVWRSPEMTNGGEDWRYRFSLLDAGNSRLDYSHVVPGDQTEKLEDIHVEVWPDLPYECWKQYWIAIEREASGEAGEYHFHVVGTSDHKHILVPLADGNLTGPFRYEMVKGRPRLLSLTKATGEYAGECGGQFALLGPAEGNPPHHDPNKPIAVAIDFGTARSAFGVYGHAGPPRSVLPTDNPSDGEPALDTNLVHLGHVAMRAQLSLHTAETVWVPTRGARAVAEADLGTNRTFVGILPSLLYLEKEGRLGVPFVDYTIPVGHQVSDSESSKKRLKVDLKWRADEEGRLYRKAYLHALLLLTVAHALRHNPKDSYQVRFSFPLAFSESELRQLKDCFDEAAKLVSESTGVLLEVAAGGLDESSCAKTACGAEFPNHNVLTADLGGGTLDLALWVEPEDAIMPRLLACDSVVFGADVLTDCWINLKLSTSLVGLTDHIFQRGWRETVEGAFNNQAQKESVVTAQKVFDRYFGAVIEYIARFLAGTMLREKNSRGDTTMLKRTTTVVLLGSGWRGYEACEEYGRDLGGFQQKLREKLTERVTELTGEAVRIEVYKRVLETGNEKAAVVVGLLKHPANSEPSQIMAPNGLEECDETSNGIQRTEWWKFAGRNGDELPKSGRPKHKPEFPDLIANHHLLWLKKEDVDTLGELLGYREGIGKRRHRPVISDIYRHFLRPVLGNPTKPGR
jgi:hypothetical protein